MGQLLSSKWVVKRQPPRVTNIPSEATAVTANIGVTERGPIGIDTLVTSWEEFYRKFGGITANADASMQAYLFFEEGGQMLHVTRTCHYSNIDSAATYAATKGTANLSTGAVSPSTGSIDTTESAPFNLSNGDTLLIEAINDGVSSGDLTTTFTGTAAQVESAAEMYALADGQTLTLKVDKGPEQSLSFLTAEFVDITTATAKEVAAVIGAKATGIRVTSDSSKVQVISDVAGSSSYVEITGGTANAVLGFSTSEQAGTGNVEDLANVTVDELYGLLTTALGVNADVSKTVTVVTIASIGTGADSSIQVKAVSTADTKIGLTNAVYSGSDGGTAVTLRIDGKTEGSYTDDVQIAVEAASSGVSSEFNLSIIVGGYVEESFPNLTMDSDNDRYIETVINHTAIGSDYIAGVDMSAAGSVLQRRPTNGSSFGPLTGGGDGLSSLSATDFIGSSVARNGMHSLERVNSVDLLIIPNYSSVSAVANAMIQYCEIDKSSMMFCIIDPPASKTAVEMVTWLEDEAQIYGESEQAATYWPRIRVSNKWESVYGSDDTVVVSPSGAIAGLYARNDASGPGGIYKTPAGSDAQGQLYTAVGFEGDEDEPHEVEDEKKRDIIFPKRINPIRRDSGPIYLDGARCLKGDGPFPFVQQSRGTIKISREMTNGLDWVRHKRNSKSLRNRVQRAAIKYLNSQTAVNAFASKDPDKAYFLDVSEQLNTPSVQASGQLLVRVGLAYEDPIEWGVLMITKDTRKLEDELGL